ncbi:TPA: hypothetical protein ACSPJ7_005557 [Bacillus cereus]
MGMKIAPLNFWTKEKGLEALKLTIEVKEKLSNQKIKNVQSIDWLHQHHL